MKAYFNQYTLIFKRPGGTSRGVLRTKPTYFIYLEKDGFTTVGECNLFKGLSADDTDDYENKLQQVCDAINRGEKVKWEDLRAYPSIQFGLEQAQLSLKNKSQEILFTSDFTKSQRGIKINGLIWMGSLDFMVQQVKEKLENQFSCIKIKIGTNWEEEKLVLKDLRKQFSKEVLELRVDANGAFSFEESRLILKELADLDIHSIEQPIKQGNWDEMAKLCRETPVPIALDEELIGIFEMDRKKELINHIKPQYIILKPALIGGFKGSQEWINLVEKENIGWWITSALESNIGLNAIAQFTATLDNQMPQGLGTGSLFTNNIESRLEVRGEKLWFKS
ncbi:o-succinylbenzoate synthase [Weeksellaceae bacterium TAE3-ERU29]|nr:o-succinylbenzoate synthase [Weeksellaceae bacterium TAE3-ERU29]